MKDNRVSRYVVRGHKRTVGWLSRVDAEIFATIMVDQRLQGAKGDALEIGIHHGRSFILLSLCVGVDENAIAVDVFDNQELNIGGESGKGNLAKFKYNLARYGDEARTKIISKSSLDLGTAELNSITSGLRFVSIDGGHWFDAVLNDLRLAAACAGRDCVIALDDLFHPDFPEVAAGYYAWLQDKPDFVPLCVSKGKLYQCRPGTARHYSDIILKNDYLRFHFKKQTIFMNHNILAITGRYGGIAGVAKQYLSFYAPAAYEHLKRWKNKTGIRDQTPAPVVRESRAP
jgi:hypothetical protein